MPTVSWLAYVNTGPTSRPAFPMGLPLSNTRQLSARGIRTTAPSPRPHRPQLPTAPHVVRRLRFAGPQEHPGHLRWPRGNRDHQPSSRVRRRALASPCDAASRSRILRRGSFTRRRNTFGGTLPDELVKVFDLFDRDDRVRVVILTADPTAPAYCSGVSTGPARPERNSPHH